MFLCRTVAHDLDWNRALDGIEPWRLAVWEAYYRLEPWGDDWMQAAKIEAAILNGYEKEPVNPCDLVPNEDNRKVSGELEPADIHAGFMGLAGL